MKKRASKKKSVKKKVIKTENVCDQICENKILCWIPRVLAILFVVFISLFALDAFGEDGTIGEMMIGFLIHLIPSLILLGLLIVAWKCKTIGGWLFIIAGIIFTAFFETYGDVITFLIISGPLFLIGALFLFSAMRDSKN